MDWREIEKMVIANMLFFGGGPRRKENFLVMLNRNEDIIRSGETPVFVADFATKSIKRVY